MGCKFKYNGQTYESEAELKAVLRQELKANTAKVRDGESKGNFLGYVRDNNGVPFDPAGKGAKDGRGDGKDKAMRKAADGFIGELAKFTPSSTLTSAVEIFKKSTPGVDEDTVITAANFAKGAIAPAKFNENAKIIMLASNGSRSGKPLFDTVKAAIKERHDAGATFIVGDMPGADTRFIDYLNEIGATYKIYTTNPVGTEFDRSDSSGQSYRDKLKPNVVDNNNQSNTTIQPKGTINVYWGQAESATSTKILSNLAPRGFTYKGVKYRSVEHAYQVLKSGSVDSGVKYYYDNLFQGKSDEEISRMSAGQLKYNRGRAADRSTNLQLMKDLVVTSFEQNPDSPAAKKLLQYENFTHNTSQVIDQAFLEGLKLAQAKLLSSQPTQQSATTETQAEAMLKVLQEMYPKIEVVSVTNQSEFAGASDKVFNQTFRNDTDFGVAINKGGAKLYQSIYHILPNVSDAQLKTIYDNYVSLMSKNANRVDSAMSYEVFTSLLDSYQVFNYKDTYIFGQYNFDDNVFITRVNSSPTAKELLAEALPIISKNFDVISFVPEDLRDKYVRSGYISSEESYPYDFKGEKMFKFAVVSNSNVAKRVFGTDIKNVTADSIEEYNDKQSLKSNYTFVKGMKGIELLSNIAEKMYILAAVRFRLSYEQENNYYSSRMRSEGLSDDEIGYVFSWIKRLKIEEANSFNEIFAKIQLAELQGGVLKDIVNITDVANNALNTKLQDWVGQYGVEVKSIDEYRKRTGKDTLGAADVLNKVIYYNSENANVMDFPEDVAHFYIEMMGIRHPLIKDALNKVTTWSEYSSIFEQYKEQYIHEDGTPDVLRIKKVAISRAIATRLVGKSKIETSAFWALIDEIIQKIKAIFKGDISKFNLELIADELAEDILSNTGKYLGSGSYSEVGIPTNFELKSYEEAMKKAPHLQEIVNAVSSMGGILTGSLAYRKQGTTYRKTTETIHDLDFTIPYDAHKDQGSSQYIQTAFEKFGLIRAVKPGSNEYLAWEDEYNIYNTVGYVGGTRIKDWKAEGYYNQGDVLWFDKNKVPLNEPRLLETGELAFDGTSVDFFFMPENLSSSITKTTDNLAFWTVAFDKKIQMGRDKDAFDYRTFIPLPEYREGPINNSHLYSKNSNKNKQQTTLNQQSGENILGQAQIDPNGEFMAGKVLILAALRAKDLKIDAMIANGQIIKNCN
jgi:hypothetical protein